MKKVKAGQLVAYIEEGEAKPKFILAVTGYDTHSTEFSAVVVYVKKGAEWLNAEYHVGYSCDNWYLHDSKFHKIDKTLLNFLFA